MPNRFQHRLWLMMIVALACLRVSSVRGSENPPLFETDIRPILKTHCFHCHGEGEKLRGDLDLRLRRFMVGHQSENGSVLVPGRPEDSLLLALVRSGEMPRGEKKLNAQETSLLERWISNGAPTARDEPAELARGFRITEEERQFWAFQPLRRPPLPDLASSSGGARTSVDLFVLTKLHERRLSFAPEADRATLIRRVSFDLTGLPPSPEAIAAFETDDAPGAYERMLDRVLASPHYGEHWAQHWLDVAGYADSNGYAEADSRRPHAWRYRDYVIRAFNSDKPWNQFILEQLAGDELAGVTQEDAVVKAKEPWVQELLTATGFLRMAPDGTGDEVSDAHLARNQVLAETIKIVSSSLLGLTVGCAQCHDHRYDPISQQDYYRFRAIFEPALNWKKWRTPSQRLISLYTLEDRRTAEEIEAEARKIDEAANQLRKDLLETVFEKELAKLPEELRDTVKSARNTPRQERTPEQVALLKQYPSADVQGALDLYDPEANKKVLAKQEEAAKLRATKPPEPFLMGITEPNGEVPATYVFSRGDHEQPREKVEPAELEILGGRALVGNAGLASSGRRLAYAQWLTSGRHPLVARVLVNRFWLQHFGRGLVASPGDFGRLGEKPTHPELLDWLASEFMASGWRLKSFHRLLMTSSVYRQSSINEAARRDDPDNQLFGRMRPRRLEAESLRDSLLALSGAVNSQEFGPPLPLARDGAGRVLVGQQKTNGNGDPTIVESIGGRGYRRSIYVERRRSLPLTVLEAFDQPGLTPNCEMRVSSTVSPQALMMLNDTFVLEQARLFAERLRRELPGNLRAQADRAWRLVFGVAPTEQEQVHSLIFLAEQGESIRAAQARAGATKKADQPKNAKAADNAAPAPFDAQLQALASFCQVLLGSNRFLYVD